MGKAKRFLFAVMPAAILLLTEVTAFADHIEPGPKALQGNGFLEVLPVIALSVLGLALLTGIILLIVFIVRKRKKEGSSK